MKYFIFLQNDIEINRVAAMAIIDGQFIPINILNVYFVLFPYLLDTPSLEDVALDPIELITLNRN